jgi:hypothetical protein
MQNNVTTMPGEQSGKIQLLYGVQFEPHRERAQSVRLQAKVHAASVLALDKFCNKSKLTLPATPGEAKQGRGLCLALCRS